MNKKTKPVSGKKSFYAALAVSVAMIGAACYFAYTQTSNDITGNLKSSLSSSESEKEAAEIKTDIPRVTIPPRTQQETTESETEPEDETEPSTMEPEKSEDTAKPQEKSFFMPVEGEILNEFSGGELVKSKTTGAWQTHNGIDISAAPGDSVKAAGSGTVAAVDNDPLWGITVTIDHGNGIITRYSNLNEGVTVQVGQEISGGEEIGAVGETADIETSEQSHLHFETVKNGSYANPLEIIG